MAAVRIGPVRQSFWAIWERRERRLHEATRLGRGGVRLTRGRVRIDDGAIAVDLALAETAGIETIAPSGAAYGWTRKQGGITAAGTVAISGTIDHDLHTSSTALQWIVGGYVLALAVGLVTGGRLGDLAGRRRMFLLGAVGFTLASVACGLAPSTGC